MSDGVSFMDVLVQPIKQGIIELLNDAELNKTECKFQAHRGPLAVLGLRAPINLNLRELVQLNVSAR